MINLLRSELYKLFKSKSFYICCFICVIATIVVAFTYNFLQNNMSPEMLEQMNNAAISDKSSITSPNSLFTQKFNGQLFLSQSFTGNTLQIILAVFVSLFVSSEFTTGTIKNIVAKGFTRFNVYFAKLIIVWVASILMMLIIPLTAVSIGTILWGFGNAASDLTKNIVVFFGLQILLCLALSSLFVTISVVVRSNGASIAINVCIIAFSSILTALLDAILPEGKTISQYWIQNNIIDVSSFGLTAKQITRSLIISSSYLLICVLGGFFIFQKKDIK
ncbi:ABC transporter permease subunit [Paludicola sp. MB14-C6]|uniref:ABC transporter permease subunit n=1 Tax=Paludihabitans sp. MB14-C6 TaxID=3070656 RepID=UPI0027DE41FA|nr:ABC transporter permease subunit [Paludicola sp. MB14-C6]WMJ24410.1 ABC transporter permease subunit [Paludicola sp. MB14-C6]